MALQRITSRTSRSLLSRDVLSPSLSTAPVLFSAYQSQLKLRRSWSPASTSLTSKPFNTTALRLASTAPTSQTAGLDLLAEQRRHRPVSPHLTIYRPQITWYLSSLNRITGSLLSGGFYIFGFTYLVSPLLGWHMESAHLAELFGSLPAVVKGAIKFFVALPFTFHSWNGLRHLVWDSGREFSNKSVIRTGWTVVGLTVVSSLALVFAW